MMTCQILFLASSERIRGTENLLLEEGAIAEVVVCFGRREKGRRRARFRFLDKLHQNKIFKNDDLQIFILSFLRKDAGWGKFFAGGGCHC